MVNLETVDCVVVGAGPAGLSAAETIAKSGLKVIVLEEQPTIGLPLACGEGISIEKLKEFNIPTDVISSSNKKALVEKKVNLQRFFFGEGGIAFSTLDVAIIDRTKFDQFLATRAQKAGAEIKTETTVINLKSAKTHITVQTRNSKGESDSIVTNVVIGGDGPASRIRKWTGLDTKTMEVVQGIEYRVKGVLTDALDFYFDHDAFPEGYGWVFPKKETTNIGIVCIAKQNPRERLDNFIKEIGHKSAIQKLSVEKVIAGIIPSTGPLPKTFTDRVLLIGDAGGFPNMVFYGGIAIAMHTGRLAGKTVIKANKQGNFDEESLKHYENAWRKMPYADESIARAHQIFYHKLTNNELNAMGMILDGIDISKMRRRHNVIFTYRTLRHPTFIKYWKYFFQLIDGFAIARDYGF